jgi:hypothetical protein
VSRGAIVAAALLVAGSAGASEKLGVIAVADPPLGPDADLAELAHQLRAACRDRVGGVEEVSTMRARLLGQGSNATESELDRAYGGALAVYQNGEFESAHRTLRAIVDDLEALPESDEAYRQWKRAVVRLAHAALTIGSEREMDEAFAKLARTEPTHPLDPDQYSPRLRRRFEEVKSRIRALPVRRLSVVAEGTPGTVYVNGRAMGATPLSITLPAGVYRIGGASNGLRVPSFTADLESEDRSVTLDFALAASLRVNAGPGLALLPAQRAAGVIRAGAWLGVDKLIVASRVEEGQAQFLLGSIYDVRRGALLREGSVRMVAGSVPSVNLGALASFLLTGQSSREVKDRRPETPRDVARASPEERAPSRFDPALAARGREPASADAVAAQGSTTVTPPAAPRPATVAQTPAPRARPDAAPVRAPDLKAIPPAPASGPPPRALAAVPPASSGSRAAPAWMRPAGIGSAVLALGFTGLAVHQGLASSRSYSDAEAMLAPNGAVEPPPGTTAEAAAARYRALRADGSAAARNAYVSAGAAVVFAASAAVLGWKSWGPADEPMLAFHF